ncbi:hypothetical protein AJ78_05044 [Emergomyces pasteurianus Ep9510]|uniref:Uncharacterized protein n=1 Tax=Emergomyces pasteurianus Ep9510 TaxID=1447872 RepID=A0A1J9PF24_9EURO|nr:hypothetical protein AJ78_05044 [Emergomyces pasteurianus Ep9510]
MPRDRAAYRNVRFYDASTGASIGGFYQNGSITEENLIWILNDVLLIVEPEHPCTIQNRASGQTMTPSSNPVAVGDYDIYSTGSIQVTNERWSARLISHSVSGREDKFRDGVRARDGKCVISGTVNPRAQWGNWEGFEAAHIFPLQKESLWVDLNFERWITDDAGGTKIHSIQNGLLMAGNLHSCFDQYLFSINPDDGYKIVEFEPSTWGIDGRILDPVCRNPSTNTRVSDELLRWHFRQSVLANMRGVGEPIFESDFPPGSDMMATLRDELHGKERFELELESRLRPEITNQ